MNHLLWPQMWPFVSVWLMAMFSKVHASCPRCFTPVCWFSNSPLYYYFCVHVVCAHVQRVEVALGFLDHDSHFPFKRFLFCEYKCLPACESVHHVCASCPRTSEEDVGAQELVIDGCKPPCRCWKLNPGPLWGHWAISLDLSFIFEIRSLTDPGAFLTGCEPGKCHTDTAVPNPWMGAGDKNFSPYACRASILPTERLPSSCFYVICVSAIRIWVKTLDY